MRGFYIFSCYTLLSWSTQFPGLVIPTKTYATNKNELTVYLFTGGY